MKDQMLLTASALLPAGSGVHWRICPWDDVNTHVLPGSRIQFRTEVKAYSIGSMRTSLLELNEAFPSPFNPQEPMRHLDRNVPDTILLVDQESADTQQGGLIWQEVGAVNEHKSPVFTVSQDTTNKRVYYLELRNLEAAPLLYSVEIYATII